MGMPNWQNRTLFHADNLGVLRKMNSESVDLIATDPPFNKSRDFHSTPDKLGPGASFHDRWDWNVHVHPEWVKHLQADMPALMEAIESGLTAHSPAMGAYLCYMSVRLWEMHRVLKPAGSIYLHCDPTASHYLKACMDAIFGKNQFRNEIVWHYTGGGRSKRYFSRKHDLIYWYAKDARRCMFNIDDMRIPYKPTSGYAKGGIKSKSGKRYQPHPKGTPVDDVWDIPIINPLSKERVGYPTQKPLVLYERIIKASTQKGDVVLDPFAGCATTCIAAEKLERQWVGIDIWAGAKDIVIKRMERQRSLAGGKLKRSGTNNQELFSADFIVTKELPTRTDDGKTAAMDLPPTIKYAKKAWERLSPSNMRERLLEVQKDPNEDGLYLCAGCGRSLEAPFFEMDHINPKAASGVDTIDNRIMLCRPCNFTKKHNLTLSGLWASNKADGWMQDESMTKYATYVVKELVKRLRNTLQ